EEGDDLLPVDRGKALEEIVDRVPGLKVVEEGLDRHSGSTEHGSSAHHGGIARNHRSVHEGKSTSEEPQQQQGGLRPQLSRYNRSASPPSCQPLAQPRPAAPIFGGTGY